MAEKMTDKDAFWLGYSHASRQIEYDNEQNENAIRDILAFILPFGLALIANVVTRKNYYNPPKGYEKAYKAGWKHRVEEEGEKRDNP